MTKIEFSKQEKAELVDKVQQYFNDEPAQEIGQFDAEFLLDFFSEKVGVYYYNKGLADARTVIERNLDNITDAIYEIEQPTIFLK